MGPTRVQPERRGASGAPAAAGSIWGQRRVERLSALLGRAYAAVATLAVVFVGGAIGGIAQDDFSGWLADALSLLDLVLASIDSIHWIFGEEIFRPFSGPEYLLWLGRLAAALLLALLWRTHRQAKA
jgi:hypothetical protein